ncbi:hypothetical protein [Vibrio vulnificus]|uniref:hypothetical protein n=1 Tax=Vibrio vulnificus TaxID=672 RepID=UPI003566B171
MLSRFSPLLKTLLHDLKCYIKTIHASFCELNIKENISKYRVKGIEVSFSDEILLERSKLVLDRKDFFLGGTSGKINGLDSVPNSLRYLQLTPYFFIKPHRFNKKGDIKIVWDRCRGYHLPVLALSKPELLFDAIREYRTFLFFGYMWSSPMEVSFRAINIILALSLLSEEHRKKIPDIIFVVLHQHASYLHHNFEIGPSGHTNNHYLSNIIAAELLSQVLVKNRGIYRNTVVSEINKQFCKDGSNFEGSTSYHFLSTELVFWFFMLDQGNTIEYVERLQRAIGVCQLLIDSKGNIPFVGDNDSGAVIKLLVSVTKPNMVGRHFIYNNRTEELIENLANYGERTSFFVKYITPKPCEELYSSSKSQLPLDGMIESNKFVFPFLNEYKVYYLSGISLFVIKTKSQYLTIKCGPLGQLGRGGHDHHDQGSFTLTDIERGINIRDVGTGSYSDYHSDFSNCRGVITHNNFIDTRQALFDSSKPFKSMHPSGEYSFNGNEITVVINYGDFKVARKFSFQNMLIVEDFVEDYEKKVKVSNLSLYDFYSMYGVKA